MKWLANIQSAIHFLNSVSGAHFSLLDTALWASLFNSNCFTGVKLLGNKRTLCPCQNTDQTKESISRSNCVRRHRYMSVIILVNEQLNMQSKKINLKIKWGHWNTHDHLQNKKTLILNSITFSCERDKWISICNRSTILLSFLNFRLSQNKLAFFSCIIKALFFLLVWLVGMSF